MHTSSGLIDAHGLVGFLLVVNKQNYAKGTDSGAGEGKLRGSRHYGVFESM